MHGCDTFRDCWRNIAISNNVAARASARSSMPPSRFPPGRAHGTNWAGCAQFSLGTPKATRCAEHEFFAGPLLKQSEAFREHAVESKALLKQLVTEAALCLTRSRQ